MARCKCVIETAGGEWIRCAQMLQNDDDDFCYFHGKQMNNPSKPAGCPAPREMDDPDRPVAYHRKVKGGVETVLTFEQV